MFKTPKNKRAESYFIQDFVRYSRTISCALDNAVRNLQFQDNFRPFLPQIMLHKIFKIFKICTAKYILDLHKIFLIYMQSSRILNHIVSLLIKDSITSYKIIRYYHKIVTLSFEYVFENTKLFSNTFFKVIPHSFLLTQNFKKDTYIFQKIIFKTNFKTSNRII